MELGRTKVLTHDKNNTTTDHTTNHPPSVHNDQRWKGSPLLRSPTSISFTAASIGTSAFTAHVRRHGDPGSPPVSRRLPSGSSLIPPIRRARLRQARQPAPLHLVCTRLDAAPVARRCSLNLCVPVTRLYDYFL